MKDENRLKLLPEEGIIYLILSYLSQKARFKFASTSKGNLQWVSGDEVYFKRRLIEKYHINKSLFEEFDKIFIGINNFIDLTNKKIKKSGGKTPLLKKIKIDYRDLYRAVVRVCLQRIEICHTWQLIALTGNKEFIKNYLGRKVKSVEDITCPSPKDSNFRFFRTLNDGPPLIDGSNFLHFVALSGNLLSTMMFLKKDSTLIDVDKTTDDFIFLRDVEGYLKLMADRQYHLIHFSGMSGNLALLKALLKHKPNWIDCTTKSAFGAVNLLHACVLGGDFPSVKYVVEELSRGKFKNKSDTFLSPFLILPENMGTPVQFPIPGTNLFSMGSLVPLLNFARDERLAEYIFENYLPQVIFANYHWDKNGLNIAALNGDLNLVKCFFNYKSTDLPNSKLSIQQKSNSEVEKWLIACTRDNRWRGVLYSAAEGGSVPVMDYLLKKFKEILKMDSLKLTLEFILKSGSEGELNLGKLNLFKKICHHDNLNLVNYFREKPFNLILEWNQVRELFEEMMSKNSNISANFLKYWLEIYPELISYMVGGLNVLFYAILNHNEALVDVVLDKKKTELFRTTIDGQPLNAAQFLLQLPEKESNPDSRMAILKKCFEKKEDLKNEITTNGMNLLDFVCRSGSLEKVTLFLTNYPEFKEYSSKKGPMCLIISAKRGYKEIMKYLIEQIPKLLELFDSDGNNVLASLINYIAETLKDEEILFRERMEKFQRSASYSTDRERERSRISGTLFPVVFYTKSDKRKTVFGKTIHYNVHTNSTEQTVRSDIHKEIKEEIKLCIEILEILLVKCPKLLSESCNNKGDTPLQLAINHGLIDIANYFHKLEKISEIKSMAEEIGYKTPVEKIGNWFLCCAHPFSERFFSPNKENRELAKELTTHLYQHRSWAIRTCYQYISETIQNKIQKDSSPGSLVGIFYALIDEVKMLVEASEEIEKSTNKMVDDSSGFNL